MKVLKMLGLTAMAAAALMAFLGAGTASATVICKTVPTAGVCPEGWDYPAGTKGKASLRASTSALLETTSGAEIATCTGSTVEGTSENTGGATSTVKSTLTTLTWEGCNQTTDTINPGTGELHWIPGTNNGTLVTFGTIVTMGLFGVSCSYGTGEGTTMGTTVGGNPGRLMVNAVVPRVAGNTLLCPPSARFTAEYVATEPTAAWVAER
jgi:hypothetical protein